MQVFSGSHSSSKHFAKCSNNNSLGLLTNITSFLLMKKQVWEGEVTNSRLHTHVPSAVSTVLSTGQKQQINIAFGINSYGFKSYVLTM